MRLNQVTVPALDVAASIAFYKTLGLRLIVESPHYARFELPDGEATFSIHLVTDAGRAADGAASISNATTSTPASPRSRPGHRLRQRSGRQELAVARSLAHRSGGGEALPLQGRRSAALSAMAGLIGWRK
ncbi:MAG: VOC family protein [Rhizomicrobium sp.]